MTAIVGLIQDGKVYMGGDATGSDGFTLGLRKQPKVFEREGLLFGYTSSFRMGQLLEHKLNIPKHHLDVPDLKWIITELVDAIRTTFKDGGYTEVTSQVEHGGCFLIGYRGHLYRIESDFQVYETLDEFAAVGSGEYHAMGALFALRAAALGPEERLRLVLEAAAHFVVTVNAPFTIISAPTQDPTP